MQYRACGKEDKRVRDLPAALMVYYVIALNLFPGVADQSVLRWLLSGLQWLGNHPIPGRLQGSVE